VERERVALAFGKCGSFIKPGIVEEIRPVQVRFYDGFLRVNRER
jgi:hypothetical protein